MAPAFEMRSGRILYIDAYDSFANNIIALVEDTLDAKVVTIKIDDDRFLVQNPSLFIDFLRDFDAVIAGPGPGTVTNERDVGLIRRLWDLKGANVIPVLGICLGFQSLATAFGATIDRLAEPRHGVISEVLHKGCSIFKGIHEVKATQYHSLHANIGHPIQTQRAVSYPGEIWQPTRACPKLKPLGWDFENARNGPVLMAIQHIEKPFWGVQFHPESICTNEEGRKIIKNWWDDAQIWIREQLLARRKSSVFSTSKMSLADFDSLRFRNSEDWLQSNSSHHTKPKCTSYDPASLANIMVHGDSKVLPDLPPETVHVATCGSGRLRVADVCNLLEIPGKEAIVLESCLQEDFLPLKTGTGRYSIIGLVIPGETLRLHYFTKGRRLQLRTGNDELYLETGVADVWTYIKTLMEHLKPKTKPAGPTFAPFWGGLVGYISYEAGLETIGVEPSPQGTGPHIPDICFAYITRSIVFDHKVKKIYVQSIRGQDMHWVSETRERIYTCHAVSTPAECTIDPSLLNYIRNSTPLHPSRTSYCDQVSACQDAISAGNSYELCLTTQNTVLSPKQIVANPQLSWSLYRKLMQNNPAPFSAYVHLQASSALHILSSSPERFMSWNRNGCSQCRPIKGTVKKGPGITHTDAEAILSTSKERAENLMIVDLVRHQLHGVYGAGNVHVSKLMEVEEYETLWQLVSVVEGVPKGLQKARTPEEWEEPPDYVSGKKCSTVTGIDALAASLPPGSMTGAPKKRSCELLKDIEGNRRRGIYSGILGYLDVGGGGDFSVVIRTAIKIGEGEPEYEMWQIGAGGAVTSQSMPEAEFAEMEVKFWSTARIFQEV